MQCLPPPLGHFRRMSMQTPSLWEEQRGLPATHTGQGSCESSVPLVSPVREQRFGTRAASSMAGTCKDDSEEVTDFMCRPACPSFVSQHLVTTLKCFHHHCHMLSSTSPSQRDNSISETGFIIPSLQGQRMGDTDFKANLFAVLGAELRAAGPTEYA